MHLVILTQVLDRRDAVLGFFHTWCERFAASVGQLTVVAQRVGETQLPANTRVIGLGKGARSLRGLRLTSALLSLPRPDAILAHMVPRYVLSAAPAAALRRSRIYLWYTHKGVDRSLRLAVPLVAKVFTASEESFRLESGAQKRVVTGHGIDGEHFRLASGPRRLDVLAVGRVSPTKGQDELLAALALLPACPSTEIAGDILLPADAAYRDELMRRASGMPVAFLGAVPYPEIADLMRGARLLVNTSRTGSVDKVVLEAMACGTIPLTCNESFAGVFGPQLARELMFPQGQPAALAACIAGMLARSVGERDALGARLRELVMAKHDVRALVPRLVAEMEAGA